MMIVQELNLTNNQRRLWFEWEKAPASVAYNNLFHFSINGLLKVSLLEKALGLATMRHPALRTCFAEKDTIVKQLIHREVPTNLQLIDCKNYNDRMAAISKFNFSALNLTQAPLFQYALVVNNENEFLLMLKWHHIITDGLSIKSLLREISNYYTTLCKGNEVIVKAYPSDIPSQLIKECELQESGYYSKGLEYWRERLVDYEEVDFSINKVIPTNLNDFPYSHRIYKKLTKELTTEISRILGQEKVTLFVFLMASFYILIGRYTYKTDLTIGYSVNTRGVDCFDHVGFYVNNLPIRLNLNNSKTYVEILKEVNELRTMDRRYQLVPLNKIVSSLGINTGLMPFNILVSQTPYLLDDLNIYNSECNPEPIINSLAKVDLAFLFDRTDTILLEFDYDYLKYPDWYMEDLVENYITLLHSITRHANTPICDLQILDSTKYREIVFEWNNTDKDVAYSTCIHKLIEKQVKLHPNHIALKFDDKCLTYQDLNIRANKLARYILSFHAPKNKVIGLCLHRSFEMVITIIAILKAGCAYVPINHDCPPNRIKFIIEDANLSLIVSTAEHYDKFKNYVPRCCSCIDLHKDANSISCMVRDDLPIEYDPKDLIYIMYTSGSTGVPKGVMLEHRGIVNRILWMQDYFQLSSDDVVIQKTPYTFDVSGWEFFWPLVVGAKLVIAAPGKHMDPQYLAESICYHQVSVIHFVPSMLKIFLQYGACSSLHSLRFVICSGEALTDDLQKLFFKKFPPFVKLFNLYGPTEASIDVSCWQCNPKKYEGIIPIGKPIYNTKLYILDKYLQPTPVGVLGELFIGGIGLARGYLNHDELTNRCFQRVLIDGSAVRLYKTGDLARFLSDGNIEYMGRIDSQIKIRGVRIELDEIAMHAKKYPHIKDAAAIAVTDARQEKHLKLFLVSEKKLEASGKTIREFMVDFLPAVMLPSASNIIFLDAIPLTSNGKIDRNVLAKINTINSRMPNIAKSHMNFLEKELLKICVSVLQIPERSICIDDNFFEAGGDSFMAVRLTEALNKKFDCLLQLADIFKVKRIADLGDLIVKKRRQDNTIKTTRKLTKSIDLYLTDAQLEKYYDSLKPETSDMNNIVLLFKLYGEINYGFMEKAVQHLIVSNPILVSRVENKKKPIFKVGSIFTAPFLAKQYSGLTGNEEDNMVLTSVSCLVNRKVEVTRDPLFQVEIVTFDGGINFLQIYLHHIIADLHSTRLLTKKLFENYNMISRGIPFDAKPNYFDDSFIVQNELFTESKEFYKQRNYWLRKLLNKRRVLRLVKDLSDGPDEYCSCREFCRIDRAVISKIKTKAKENKSSLFVTALALFVHAVQRTYLQDEFAVGCVVSKRQDEKSFGKLGLFNNYLLIQNSFTSTSNAKFTEVFYFVASEFIHGIQNTDISYAYLKREINMLEGKKRNLDLFNIIFDLQESQQAEKYHLEGVREIEQLPLPNSNKSRRDISFRLEIGRNSKISVRYRKNIVAKEKIGLLIENFITLANQGLYDE